MDKKGFTLVELLAVLVVLSLVVGISATSISSVMKKSKEKSTETFIETIKDAMDIYLSGNEKREFNYIKCSNNPEYYEATGSITFNNVINSTYKPINKNALINPANDEKCDSNAKVKIYRNENYSYFYKISGSDLKCGITSNISSLPEGFTC